MKSNTSNYNQIQQIRHRQANTSKYTKYKQIQTNVFKCKQIQAHLNNSKIQANASKIKANVSECNKYNQMQANACNSPISTNPNESKQM